MKHKKYTLFKISLVFLTMVFLFRHIPLAFAENVVLSLSPNSGSFVVGSTFDVSVYLNTHGQSVNTIQLDIKYPPDKAQLVSSSTGKSIIGIWTSQPHYDNQTGDISLVGGIPGGVNVSQGLITTLTFRVRAVGSAVIKFNDSRVLLNDGLGTEVLTQAYNSVYDLTLPPPQGPIVVSDTHPDQTLWYNNANATLKWSDENTFSAFSYILNDSPIDSPDDISEGNNHNVTYHNLSDGRHYFHIKGLRNGQWGGVTHYAINVDTSPPAEYKIDIIPGARTVRKQPVIQFATTDAYSGLDHYELNIVPLNQISNPGQQFFIEAQSPYVPSNLDLGSYDVIVRAFDKAGNVREVTQRLDIVTALFQFVGNQGLELKSNVIISWPFIWAILLLILIILGFIAYRMRLWHRFIHHRHTTGELPNKVQDQIAELQKYRDRYGKLSAVILLVLSLGMFLAPHKSFAQESQVLAPPVITTISKDITNTEIFYVGGKTGAANNEVVIYLQNLQTSETVSEDVTSDKNGDWFYRSSSFLAPGNYVIWTQSKQDKQASPPSPQVHLSVEAAALQFGATRLSYATLYLILFLLALLILILLAAFIIYHFYHGRRKHKLLMGQINEAEASVRRGFAVLNRDLEAELEIIKKARLSRELSMEELKREQQLQADLKDVEQYLSKEIWEIQDTEVRI